MPNWLFVIRLRTSASNRGFARCEINPTELCPVNAMRWDFACPSRGRLEKVAGKDKEQLDEEWKSESVVAFRAVSC